MDAENAITSQIIKFSIAYMKEAIVEKPELKRNIL